MRAQIYKFTVQGKRGFPFDMLRRDGCFPAGKLDVEAIATESPALRRVELQGINPPNCERWKSFGWQVLMSEKL